MPTRRWMTPRAMAPCSQDEHSFQAIFGIVVALGAQRVAAAMMEGFRSSCATERRACSCLRIRYRNGLEGRISQLKRKGLPRTRSRSLEGAQTWVRGITLAHNLQRMALLT